MTTPHIMKFPPRFGIKTMRQRNLNNHSVSMVLLAIMVDCLVLPGLELHAQEPVKLVKTRLVQDNFFAITGGGTGETPYEFAPPISNGDAFLKTWDTEIFRMRDGITTPILVKNDPRVPPIKILLSLYVFDDVIVFGAQMMDGSTAYFREKSGVIEPMFCWGGVDPACNWPLTSLNHDVGAIIRDGDDIYISCIYANGHHAILRFRDGVTTEYFATTQPTQTNFPSMTSVVCYSIEQGEAYIVGKAGNDVGVYKFINGLLTYLRPLSIPSQAQGSLYWFDAIVMDGRDIAYVVNQGFQNQYLMLDRNGKAALVYGVGSSFPVHPLIGSVGSLLLKEGNLMFVSGDTTKFTLGYLAVGSDTLRALEPLSAVGDEKILIGRTSTLNGQSFSILAKTQANPSSFNSYKVDVVYPEAELPVADFDGDNMADLAVFEDMVGTWFLRQSDSNEFASVGFGYPGIKTSVSDFDGDGISDISVFDDRSGSWYIYNSGLKSLRKEQFGYLGVTPVPADYDGDGKGDLGVYDPASGMWYLYGSTDGFAVHQFGYPGVIPQPRDMDGDGKADLVVYDTKSGWWYQFGSAEGFQSDQFGYPGALAASEDYDGDGRSDLCVYDSSTGNWYRFDSADGFKAVQFGYGGTKAIPADYDGDGKADVCIHDPQTGKWFTFGTTSGFSKRDI